MTSLDTDPAEILVDTTEGPVTVTCTWAADLPAGVTVSSAVCTLTRVDNGVNTPGGLSSTASVATPVITQKLLPSGLQAGQEYRLRWKATLSNSDVVTKRTKIVAARP